MARIPPFKASKFPGKSDGEEMKFAGKYSRFFLWSPIDLPRIFQKSSQTTYLQYYKETKKEKKKETKKNSHHGLWYEADFGLLWVMVERESRERKREGIGLK